jgi:hypothetical protein
MTRVQKAILIDIDSKNNNRYINEDEHTLVDHTEVQELKARLNQVSSSTIEPGVFQPIAYNEGAVERAGESRLRVGFDVAVVHLSVGRVAILRLAIGLRRVGVIVLVREVVLRLECLCREYGRVICS